MPVTKYPDFQATKAGIYREMDHALTNSMNAIERTVKLRYTGPTGSASLSVQSDRLRSSVRREKKGGPWPAPIEARVYMPPPSEGGPVYARIHEFGGVIRPRRFIYLHFKVGGRWVRARQVRIPARPVWAKSFEESRERVRGMFLAASARIRLATR